MKDWILRNVFLSTGRKFIPVGKNDVVIQSKSKYILLLIFLEFYDPHLGIIEWTVHDNTGI